MCLCFLHASRHHVRQFRRSHSLQQEISNREHRSLIINLEDLEKVRLLCSCWRYLTFMAADQSSRLQYCSENEWEDFYVVARANAQRLSKLLAEAADEVMPDPSLTANLNRDVFDVLLHNVRLCS